MALIRAFSRSADSPDPFEALVGPHVEPLYRVARRYTGSGDEAEDLVQELLTRLYPRRGELASVRELRPWLLRSLHNLFIDRQRQRARRPWTEGGEGEGEAGVEGLASPEPGPAARVENQLTAERLQGALMGLNPDQRAVVTLHDIEGYTLEELATVLAAPVGTLKSRLHRARAQLRRELMEPSGPSQRETGQGGHNDDGL
jgi:RNA polymerase sigma-70 factor (ECF subfamily)